MANQSSRVTLDGRRSQKAYQSHLQLQPAEAFLVPKVLRSRLIKGEGTTGCSRPEAVDEKNSGAPGLVTSEAPAAQVLINTDDAKPIDRITLCLGLNQGLSTHNFLIGDKNDAAGHLGQA